MAARYVYIRKGGVVPALAPLYSGPYTVIAAGDKFFRLAVGNKEEVVSIDRLKPHLGLAPVDPAKPPQRGRPIKLGH
jgi:hypothetical protein